MKYMSTIFDEYRDDSVNPGDDFYKYATGKWIEKHPQPAEFPRWGVFRYLHEENIKQIEKLIKKENKSDIGKKINTYYKLLTDYKKLNSEGVQPLKQYLNNTVNTINDRQEFINFCAKNRKGGLLRFCNTIDAKDSANHAIYITNASLMLGNKDYYLVKSDINKTYIKAYKKYVIALYKELGYTIKEAKQKFKIIFKIEKEIAKRSYSIEEEQNPVLNYTKYNVDKLSKIVKFDIRHYMSLYGYDNTNTVIVEQIKQLKFICKLLNTLSLDNLKTLIEWRTMSGSSNVLGDKIQKIAFNFNKVFTGAKKQISKKKNAIYSVEHLFSEIIGQMYVKKYFSEKSKNGVIKIVNNLRNTFKEIILSKDWISDETKNIAIKKLETMTIKIGYPDKFIDYSDIPINKDLSLFENKHNISEYFFNKDKELFYNKPVDRALWSMPPQTVNAYYDPCLNEICFPAGILQFPFYDINRPVVYNYGLIGVIIGHEITHGYDNHGREFDDKGNMNIWWKEDEIAEFNNLSQNTIERFNSLDALPDLKCNGTLTLGENLADYGGLKMAYNAFKQNEELTDGWEKEFFIAYANAWAGVSTPESIRRLVLNDEHSVNFVRVNGTLPMFNEWYDAFDITEDNILYVSPDKRAQLW